MLKAGNQEVVLGLPATEVRALRNLVEGADLVPLEVKGPPEIFRRLLHEFKPLEQSLAGD